MKAIYLEPDEEITSVIDRLRAIDDDEVAIVVPKRAGLLQSIVNLKLLRHQAEQQGKRINIVTTDKTGRNLASAVGLTVHQKLPEGGKAVKESAVQESGTEPAVIGFKRRPPEQPQKPSDAAAGSDDIGYKEGKGPELVRREISDEPAPVFNPTDEVPETSAVETPAESPEPELAKASEAPAAKAAKRSIASRFKVPKPKLPKVKVPKVRVRRPAAGKGLKGFGRRGTIIGAIILIVLLTGGTAAAVVLPRATITVVPKVDPLHAEIPVKFSTTAPEVDTKENILPAKTAEITTQGSLEAEATGRSIGGEPARGEITVVNGLNRNQPLVVRTRFESPDGRIFRAQSGLVVPAGGSTTVQVVADEGGAKGNLKSGTRLSIPGLQSTTAVYGKVDKKLTGGTDADDTTISQQDVDRASKTLTAQLARKGLAQAKKKVGVGYALNPEVVATEVITTSANPGVGRTASRFTVTGRARLTYFAYSEEQLEKLVEADLKIKVPGGTNLVEQRSEKFRIKESSDQVLATALVIDTFTTSGLVAEQVATDIAGKSPAEARQVIESSGKVSGVTIDLSPFWVRSIPGDTSKITVRFEVDTTAVASPTPKPSPRSTTSPSPRL